MICVVLNDVDGCCSDCCVQLHSMHSISCFCIILILTSVVKLTVAVCKTRTIVGKWLPNGGPGTEAVKLSINCTEVVTEQTLFASKKSFSFVRYVRMM